MKKRITERIREELLSMQDLPYREFHCKLMPTVDADEVIGIRVPILRKYAKTLIKEPDIQEFLDALPHKYFEENNVHGFLIEQIRDYETCMKELKKFLPYINNWATCDMTSPKIFKKHKDELLMEIRLWIVSGQPYTIRYGIGMLMQHYLDEDFQEEYLELAAGIRSEEYYVNMMIAWYFATALAKQYEKTIPYLRDKKLDIWTHNKAIQKACESYRITREQKEYLRTLKIKNNRS
ncbi:DNA alkylation repair protein [Blautia sp.]|uniref:DNA alkylation repair enzyme n=1 Tax=Blautia glucerasea TaxID=536633 RepID=A0A6N2TPZ7_9FIRM